MTGILSFFHIEIKILTLSVSNFTMVRNVVSKNAHIGKLRNGIEWICIQTVFFK